MWVLGALALIAVALAVGTMLLGYPAMLLWNSFAPAVLSVALMTYWQSVCMLWFVWIVLAPAICVLLFGSILSAAAVGSFAVSEG